MKKTFEQGELFLLFVGLGFVILYFLSISNIFMLNAGLIAIYSIIGMLFALSDVFNAFGEFFKGQYGNKLLFVFKFLSVLSLLFASLCFVILQPLYFMNQNDFTLIGDSATLLSLGIIFISIILKSRIVVVEERVHHLEVTNSLVLPTGENKYKSSDQ